MKRLSQAKTRLALSAGGGGREEFALAFAVDTAVAAAAASAVTVVTDDPHVRTAMLRHSVDVVSDGGATGLNEAIRFVIDPLGARSIAVLTADLPALRGLELAEALRRGAAYPRSFVADANGTGTVLLMGRADDLQPGFGDDSARRHREAGFTELDGAWPGLRRDVDTARNLADARALGTGPRTARLLSAFGSVVGPLTHV